MHIVTPGITTKKVMQQGTARRPTEELKGEAAQRPLEGQMQGWEKRLPV